MSKLLTLEEWAATVYGERPPSINTLRRWARESRIYPIPERHGRSYYVAADARYLDPAKPPPAPPLPTPRERRGTLVERLRRGSPA